MEFEAYIRKSLGVLALLIAATSATADTYRWKDKDGNIHYGESVPAEYADQPYDVINKAGLVIEHVEDPTMSVELRKQEEQKAKERAPLISEDERERQYNRLLVIQYRSEEAIIEARDNELAQLTYDRTIIEQARVSTINAIRQQIREAADRQRANLPIPEEQLKAIDNLYARLDESARSGEAMDRREAQIRERFDKDLERYRQLTARNAGREDPG